MITDILNNICKVKTNDRVYQIELIFQRELIMSEISDYVHLKAAVVTETINPTRKSLQTTSSRSCDSRHRCVNFIHYNT